MLHVSNVLNMVSIKIYDIIMKYNEMGDNLSFKFISSKLNASN